MSTPAERLALVHDSFSKAYQRRAEDLKNASSTEQAKQILDNLDDLEDAYLDAARDALDSTGQAVEQAFEAASRAKADVESAYSGAKALGEKIRLVTSLALGVKQLVLTATGGGASALAQPTAGLQAATGTQSAAQTTGQ